MTYATVFMALIFSFLPVTAKATPCPENLESTTATPNAVVEIRPCISLKNVSLIRSNLTNVHLNSSQLELIDIKESFADKAKFDQTVFRSVRIQRLKAAQAGFAHTKWYGGIIKESELVGANFSASTLSGSRWHSLNLSGANLRNIKASNCFFEQINLEDADLRGAHFDNCIFIGVKLRRARFNKDTLIPLTGAEMAQQGMEFRP